jgi:DnaJ domain
LDDPYKVLQVDPSAEQEVIEAVYRRLARKYHPDANPAPEATARMRDLNAAYEILKDPERRAEHDLRRWAKKWSWTDQPAPQAGAEPAAEPGPDRGRRANGQSPWSDRPSCWRHATLPAVDACCVCGVRLCRSCASQFQPSGCTPCVLRMARRVRHRALSAAALFALAFTVVGYVAFILTGAGLAASLMFAYLAAATALGIAVVGGRMWRTGWLDEPNDLGLGVTFLVWIGILVGWIGAPVLLGKLALDFKRAWQLAAAARAVPRLS